VSGGLASDRPNAPRGLRATILRGKRPEVYARLDSKTNVSVGVQLTLEQAAERLRQLGLPVPFIETEYDEIDAADSKPTTDTTSTEH
jgi:hypothetical protein